MTGFFIAGVEPGGKGAEAAYDEVRERSQTIVGAPARLRRIFKLSCRHEGQDCEIEVGMPLACGNVVTAIIDHGREEAFAVHTLGVASAPVRVSRPVYSVTEFS